MSTMTFLTMRQRLASLLKIDQTVTAQDNLLSTWLNQAQQEIWAAYDWPWALDRAIVQTVADKTAGTVSVNSGATAVTGSGTAFAAVDVGKYIQFAANSDWYRITAQSSTTALTIESPYTASTNASGAAYTIRQFFYSLSSSVEKVLSIRQVRSPAKLELIHYRKFHTNRPLPQSTGPPTVYILYGYDSSANWRFTPYPWPDSIMNLEVLFKKKVTDMTGSVVTDIPEKWHQTVLMDGGLYRGLEYVRQGSDDRRSELVYQRFRTGLDQMVADYDADSDYHPRLENPDVRMKLDNIVPFPAGWS